MLPPLLGLAAAAALSVGSLGLYELGFLGRHRQRHESRTAHGTAAWARRADLRAAGINHDRGLIVGADRHGPLRLPTDRHMLTIAPTRSGKGVSTIIPNLLTYPGSVFCIDPKGENAMVTAKRRRQLGQRVQVLDPWGITGLPSACFNPLAHIDPDSPDAGDEAMLIADALVQAPNGGGDNAFWYEEARALIGGLVLHIVTAAPPEQRHLPMLRRLLTSSPEEFQRILGAMMASDGAHGLVARAANRLAQKSDREFSAVLSTAQSQTHFLDSPRLAACLERSSFALEELRRDDDPLSVYLVLPPKRLATHGRWLRLLVAGAIDSMAAAADPPRQPVLFLLDEFAALGHLGAIQRAMGLMAGFGCQLWPIVQDLAQLQSLYPTSWPTFLSNAAGLQLWSVTERDTMHYISAMLGNRTVTVRGESSSLTSGSESYSRIARPLLTPDEVRRLPPDQQILLMPGRAPALTGRAAYYRDRAFAGLFAPNPYYRGGCNA